MRGGRSPGGAAAPPKRPQAAETARRAVGLRPMPAVCRGCRWFGGFLQGARRAARPEGGRCTRSGQAPAKPGRSAGRMGGGMRCVFCRELQGAGRAQPGRRGSAAEAAAGR